ncbi:hypothetical protein [Psychrilyobacter sp.]|uniref:hypothetical protein n=1 Tax=Psychrilyobacter sp. TaxID=2586924 RepID=UPI0030194E9C
MDYKEIAKKIMKLTGETNNICGYTSCMIRLRVSVKNLGKVDLEGLKTVDYGGRVYQTVYEKT